MFSYKKLNLLFIIIIIIPMIFSCNSVETKKEAINQLNKFWTESDYQLASDSLANFVLNSNLISRFKPDRKPIIIVGNFIDNSYEKLKIELVIKNFERNLMNSGLITFISSKSKREEIRNDRKNRNNFTDQIEFKKYLSKIKADFFIDGQIDLKIDSVKNYSLKNYDVTLNVVDVKNVKSVLSKKLKIKK